MDLNNSETNKKRVCCFIHSTNILPNKTEILENIINYLNKIGFYDVVDFVYINNIGIPIKETQFQKVSNKIILNNYSIDINLFENCTLKLIHFFSTTNPEYKILYLHTKGVTHEKSGIYYSNIMDWVNFMLYCLVDNNESCIELLNNNDCIGCNYRDNENLNPEHYSGNFWWANANYINTISTNILKIKHDAEWWIFKKNPKFINIHSCTCPTGHYEDSYKLEEYKYVVINNLEYYKNNIDQMHQCNIIHLNETINGLGLTNQLFRIVTCIFDIIHNKKYNKRKNIIIIENFNKDFLKSNYCSIDEILNIVDMNNYLSKLNCIIIPKNKIKLEITKIEYGILGVHLIDVTDKIKKKCHANDNYFLLNKNIDLNGLCEDPIPGFKKKLYINFKINEISCFKLLEEFGSHITNNFEIDLFNKNNAKNEEIYTNTFNAQTRENLPLIDELFRKLKFSPYFYEKTNNIQTNMLAKYNFNKCNVIHIRNESDAIPFWGSINKMNDLEFKNILEQKYLTLIQKYLDPAKDEVLIILCSEIENNNVIDYIKNKEFNFLFFEKNKNLREVDAIVDLLLSTKLCNNIFIGNYNPITLHGSTFSYLVSNNMNRDVKKVLIDLDNINNKEYIL